MEGEEEVRMEMRELEMKDKEQNCATGGKATKCEDNDDDDDDGDRVDETTDR